jgi:hypothetical protein
MMWSRPRGPTIFIADPHRGNGKRFVLRADEKLTAFLEPRISNSCCALAGSPRFSTQAVRVEVAEYGLLPS